MSYLLVFLCSFVLAALAGLAALLRSEAQLTRKALLSASLNSGLLGLAICLIWYTRFTSNLFLLVGLTIMAGMGGTATVEWAVKAFRNGGFSVRVSESGVELKGKDGESQ